jgi:hypothetical protein
MLQSDLPQNFELDNICITGRDIYAEQSAGLTFRMSREGWEMERPEIDKTRKLAQTES